MYRLYCEVCHSMLELSEDQTVGVCTGCGKHNPIPHGYTKTESAMLYAMSARIRRDFGEAHNAYREILLKDPENSGAYWGSAVSKYGVEYQKLGEHEYRLICHQAKLGSFLEDVDYKKALDTADPLEAEIYREDGEKIQKLLNEINRTRATFSSCDIFLEVSEEHGESLKRADQIRQALTAEGHKVFAPAWNLADVPKQEREPVLFCAYEAAQAMVLVTVGTEGLTDEVSFDAQRFLAKRKSEAGTAEKEAPLILVFSELDEYADIPDKLFDGASQRLSLDSLDFFDELMAALQRKEYEKEYWKGTSATDNFNYANLLKNARLELEAGRFDEAKRLFNRILIHNPEEGQAYWGLLMAEYFDHNEQEMLAEDHDDITEDENYKNALAFSTERERQIYREIAEKTLENTRKREQEEIEEELQEAENEKLRLEKQREVERLKEQELLESEKREKRRRRKLIGIAAAVVVVAAVAGSAVFRRSQATAKVATAYEEAVGLYNQGEYWKAEEAFEALGDYKDCQELRVTSVYKAATQTSNRAQAVRALKRIEDELPRAKELLEQYRQEALDAYETGDYGEAAVLLQGFEEEKTLFTQACRKLQSRGMLSIVGGLAENMAMAAVDQEGNVQLILADTGAPISVEGGVKYQSVSLAGSGRSAAFVRQDGTVYLSGEFADSWDVSAWTDCDSVRATDYGVAALRRDGTLLTTWDTGAVMEQVKQFDYNQSGIAVVYEDGSLWCSDQIGSGQTGEFSNTELLAKAMEWENLAWAAIGSDEVAAVSEEGTLMMADGIPADCPTEDVMYVLLDGNAWAAVTADGDLQYGPSGGSWSDTYFMALSGEHTASGTKSGVDVLAADGDGGVDYKTPNASGVTEFVNMVNEWTNIKYQ